MTAIELTFPAGRYHATPWGRHVNEGVAEWPPSPYRLLRALYDVWQRKCADLPASQVEPLLETLAGTLPSFALPAATASHTRSYLNANTLDPTDKNLVFDSFLVFERKAQCYLAWEDLTLTSEQKATLETLLGNLNYLGRSESWVSARLGEPQEGFNCWPLRGDETAEEVGELVAVACATAPADYQPAMRGSGSKATKENWIQALTLSTTDLAKRKASGPPLLKQVGYRACITVETDPVTKPTIRRAKVEAAILALDAKVLPLVTATVEIAEQVRTRLMGAHRKLQGDDPAKVSALFSGKGPDGEKRLDHGHVYILPLPSDAKDRMGRIDRVLIVSRHEELDESERQAIGRVRELWQSDGRPEVRCVVTWEGGLQASPLLRGTRQVASVTPFVPPRHWRKGRDMEAFLEAEVRRECVNHGVVAAGEDVEKVELLEGHQYAGRFHGVEFRRNRKGDPARIGYAFRVSFRAPVMARFAIGYGAHFGLGQFGPDEGK